MRIVFVVMGTKQVWDTDNEGESISFNEPYPSLVFESKKDAERYLEFYNEIYEVNCYAPGEPVK